MSSLLAAVGGVCLAVLLIAVMQTARRYLRVHPLERWQRSVYFALCAMFSGAGSVYFVLCAIVPVAGLFVPWVHAWTAAGSALFAAVFAWASLGTLYQWPG